MCALNVLAECSDKMSLLLHSLLQHKCKAQDHVIISHVSFMYYIHIWGLAEMAMNTVIISHSYVYIIEIIHCAYVRMYHAPMNNFLKIFFDIQRSFL